VAREERVFAVI